MVSRLLVLVSVVVLAPMAWADAAIVTRAMTASTVAELYVTAEAVRVEIEVGAADLEAFQDLMPDEIRERLGLAAEPLETRLARFFAEGWTVRVDGGTPRAGQVTSLEGRRRLVRDEITGEPLPNQPEEAEVVVYAELTFPLGERPGELAIKPPLGPSTRAAASIGFVLFHEGLPVNDFRFLSGEETVALDWNDPWYSRFHNRSLWRQYEAPLSAYLYVEPFEVRKEVVVRPRDLARWIDLGLEDQEVIRAGEWGALKQRVVDFLLPRDPVTIDGRRIEPVLDRVHFIQRDLRTSRVLETPQNLELISATLGVIVTYPIDGLPQEASMEWGLFPDGVERVPASAVDEAGGMPTYLSRGDNVLTWTNFLLAPTQARLVALEPAPESLIVDVPLASVLCGLAGVVALIAGRRRASGLVAGGVLTVAAVAVLPLLRVELPIPFVGPPELTEEQSSQVCGDLLRNVYRAFDFREEGDIYDVLAKSTDGELLTDVYLETRRALTLENQGGARARVQEVSVTSTESTRLGDGPGFTSRCTWEVTGSVGHWGHLHQRRNRYDAELTVVPVDGQWRITGLELLDEVRL
jgi:hypothetical protein